MNINNDGFSFLEACAEGWIGLKQKTKAGSIFAKVLQRQIPVESPEVSLMLDVIAQAASDSVMDVRKDVVKEINNPIANEFESKVKIKQDAVLFFKDGRSDSVCDVIGLDHSFLADMYWRMLAVDDPRAIC